MGVMRKLGAIAVFAISIAIVWVGIEGYRDWRAIRQIDGLLRYDPEAVPSAQYTLGSFTLHWAALRNGAGRLSVSHADHRGRTLWASLPGRAFAGAARGTETVTESRGSFAIEDRIHAVCPNQTVEAVDVREGGVTFHGHLQSIDGATEVGYRLEFRAAGPNQLAFALEVDDAAFDRTYLTYASEHDERFFGGGVRCTHFDLTGKRLPIFVMEQGIGRGRQPLTFLVDLVADSGGDWHTAYAPAPHYMTSRMRSVFLENYRYNVFDFREADRVQLKAFGTRLEGNVLAGDTPADLIREYTAANGRMRPLPDWIVEGAVVGMQGGTERVRAVYDQLQEHNTPVAAFWLQDWVGQRTTAVGKQLWWNWERDTERYPKWDKLVADLETDGVRMMTYVNPFFADVAAKDNVGTNYYREAAEKGYLVRQPDGTPYRLLTTDFKAGLLDLTNPEARDWMKGILKQQVLGSGASGWMADFGEALPYDAELHSGVPAARFHNKYPEAWAELNRQAIAEAGHGRDAVFFTRSGYRQSPRYSTLFWLGDQMVTWDRYDGIKSAVTGLLTGGLSGFAFNHSDIGGYTTITTPVSHFHRSKELLLRWMELNAFSTVFRTHEGIQPGANVQFYSDDETLAHFCRCARLYKAWGFYRKSLVQEASETGLPVVRHPFIHYPHDEGIQDIEFEAFMVGRDLWVAPVLDPGKSTITTRLPGDIWVHLWSGKTFDASDTAQTATVAAPLGRPAVFYRAGAETGTRFTTNLEDLDLR